MPIASAATAAAAAFSALCGPGRANSSLAERVAAEVDAFAAPHRPPSSDDPASSGVGRRVVRRVDVDVVVALVGEDPQLRVAVGVERAVAVEVIRASRLSSDRALGREGLACPRAGSSSLADHRRLRAARRRATASGVPTLPGDRDRLARRAPDVAEQFGDGRLAVRAGDRDEAVREQPPGELELADHRQAPLAGGGDRGRRAGHPGALDQAAHVARADFRLRPHPGGLRRLTPSSPSAPVGRAASRFRSPSRPARRAADRRLARPGQPDDQIRARRQRRTWL